MYAVSLHALPPAISHRVAIRWPSIPVPADTFKNLATMWLSGASRKYQMCTYGVPEGRKWVTHTSCLLPYYDGIAWVVRSLAPAKLDVQSRSLDIR